MNDYTIPRRNRLDLHTPAELAIREAIDAVEAAGAHPHLTKAVVLLAEARNAVADFVDGVADFVDGVAVVVPPTDKDKPLTVSVTDGVLRIEIGVSTLAFATLHSQYVYDMLPERHRHSREAVEKRFSIPDPAGFAEEVRGALLSEEEDGSSLLTDLLDKATQDAVEDGALCFLDAEDEP